ncbi:MAG: hypothetical protein M1827_001592 [Pycnora praestabilis]|nr:MAG: hypothetical protein M1827_001592 [Pycnora praestabilis]
MDSKNGHLPTASPANTLNQPPPLPPRRGTAHLTPYSEPPPPYTLTAEEQQTTDQPWTSRDPRSSSTQSLVPPDSAEADKRTLLLVYIHGFMGNESSFQSFPAHVHNLLTITLTETHVVHTKIYPRYKSRKAIDFARDAFCEWLEPHESPTTDVILLGHSMGGILSAEVVLLPSSAAKPERRSQPRILGTINFDTPFLGMHPGVVVSGIGSLFRPAPDPPISRKQSSVQPVDSSQGLSQNSNIAEGSIYVTPSPPSLYQSESHTSVVHTPASRGSMTTLPTLTSTDLQTPMANSVMSPLSPTASDPNYNPPFPNDVRLPVRTGWNNALHFIVKHSDGLMKATEQYVTSHLEFGGCLADYSGLKTRYAKIRALEAVDDHYPARPQENSPHQRRVRFVNYYTASTGRSKVPKPSPAQASDPETCNLENAEQRPTADTETTSLSNPSTRSASRSSRISLEKGRGAEVFKQALTGAENRRSDDENDDSDYADAVSEISLEIDQEIDHLEPLPYEDHSEPETIPTHLQKQDTNGTSEEAPPSLAELKKAPTLPPLPPDPQQPPSFDPSIYTDKDTRKLAEKENVRVLKAYKQALKDREKAIKERQKLLEKRDKKARQDREKIVKLEEKQRLKEEKEEQKRQAALNPDALPTAQKEKCKEKEGEEVSSTKAKRDKKFCMLPPKDNGRLDPTWVRVYMQGVDEVGAHCGLFFIGEAYEKLVGDVGARIEEWVREDMSSRAFREGSREQ